MQRIEERAIVEKVFERGRWYAVMDKSFNGRKKMPLANYTWLKNNPAFAEIPTGYVIHHLDHNETNDDISNLALMQKHHHSAHHWKNKTIKPKVKMFGDVPGRFKMPTDYFPTTEPKIHQVKGRKRWFLYFQENVNGKNKQTKAYRYRGHQLTSIAMAEKFKNEIWYGQKLTNTHAEAGL